LVWNSRIYYSKPQGFAFINKIPFKFRDIKPVFIMERDPIVNLRGMSPEEYAFLKQVMAGLDQRQSQNFVMFYSGKRKSPDDILLFTLLGFLGIAGIQRFITGQVGMGILYILTVGLCFIGTIVDVINHKSLALDYNQKAAYESAQIIRMMTPSPGQDAL
jgi:TM2 domain-containing membrane protein YozV